MLITLVLVLCHRHPINQTDVDRCTVRERKKKSLGGISAERPSEALAAEYITV